MAASMKMAPHVSLVGEWANQAQNWDKLCWKGARRMFERIFLDLDSGRMNGKALVVFAGYYKTHNS